MNQKATKPKTQVRFGLRTLVLAIGLVAITIWFGRSVYEWWTTIPLAQAVAVFNETAREAPAEMHGPPITEAEITAAIMSEISALEVSDQVKAIYSQILRTRRIPRTASLAEHPHHRWAGGDRYPDWRIGLAGTIGPNRRYYVLIRETANPAAADAAKPLE